MMNKGSGCGETRFSRAYGEIRKTMRTKLKCYAREKNMQEDESYRKTKG
jgi:hypothetical protein